MRSDVLTLAQDLAAGNGSRDQTWCAVVQDLGLAAATQGSLQIYYTAATLTKKGEKYIYGCGGGCGGLHPPVLPCEGSVKS